MSKNVVQPEEPRSMGVEFWIRKATRARSHIHASTRTPTEIYNACCFSTATMIRERVYMLRYTYIACLVELYT